MERRQASRTSFLIAPVSCSRQRGSQRHLEFRPTCSRLWPSLDCASLGHRRGRNHPRAVASLRIISGAEIVKEDDSLTHERDKCGHNCKCQVAAPIVPLSVHLLISPIPDDTNNVGIDDSAIQFIVFTIAIEKIDQMDLWLVWTRTQSPNPQRRSNARECQSCPGAHRMRSEAAPRARERRTQIEDSLKGVARTPASFYLMVVSRRFGGARVLGTDIQQDIKTPFSSCRVPFRVIFRLRRSETRGLLCPQQQTSLARSTMSEKCQTRKCWWFHARSASAH